MSDSSESKDDVFFDFSDLSEPELEDGKAIFFAGILQSRQNQNPTLQNAKEAFEGPDKSYWELVLQEEI